MSNWGTTPALPDLLECKGRSITYAEAIYEASRLALAANPGVRILGEGVTDPAGTYGTTKDLHKEFGGDRVFDVPLAEGLITGMGLGMALVGLRPIVIHPRNDFMFLALDQLCNHAAKWRYMFGTDTPVPLVIRSVACRGWGSAAQHSQTIYSAVAHFPKVNVLLPATPYDAKGFLLWAALEAVEPVLIVEHKWFWKLKGPVPEGKYFSRPDGARIIKQGKDITLVGISFGVAEVLQAAQKLDKVGIDAEVIDIRSLRPLKIEKVAESVKRTGRLVVVDMDHNFCGAGAEIITQLVESLPPSVLKAKPVRVGLPDTPIPASSESTYYASPNCIVKLVAKMMGVNLKQEAVETK